MTHFHGRGGYAAAAAAAADAGQLRPMRMTWDLENGVTTTVVLPQSSVLVEVGVRISNNWLSAPLGSGLAVADVCSRKAGGGQKAAAATRSLSDSPPGYATTQPLK